MQLQEKCLILLAALTKLTNLNLTSSAYQNDDD